MKIECPIDVIDLDILGFIDHNITINIIQDEKLLRKTFETSKRNHKRNQMQKSSLHHFY